jgi:diguanylate cyclase (GGDEF)-like protein
MVIAILGKFRGCQPRLGEWDQRIVATDSLQPLGETPPQIRRLAGIALAIAGFVVLLLCKSVLSDGTSASLLTAWGLVTGALCGFRWGLVITLAAAAGDGLATPPEHAAALFGFTMRWSTTVLLLAWISRQQDRLTQEYRRARLDSLTGLPNRQAFFERCAAELARAKRCRQSLTVMLLDGDDFKLLNDREGHARGDLALQQTARTLISAVRPYDLVCRLQGDEFVLLFPETVAADAERIAARLQHALTEDLAQGFAPLTYSIGVLTISPPPPQEPADCLAEADRVLYAAKRAGKKSIRSSTISVDPSVVPPSVTGSAPRSITGHP